MRKSPFLLTTHLVCLSPEIRRAREAGQKALPSHPSLLSKVIRHLPLLLWGFKQEKMCSHSTDELAAAKIQRRSMVSGDSSETLGFFYKLFQVKRLSGHDEYKGCGKELEDSFSPPLKAGFLAMYPFGTL